MKNLCILSVVIMIFGVTVNAVYSQTPDEEALADLVSQVENNGNESVSTTEVITDDSGDVTVNSTTTVNVTVITDTPQTVETQPVDTVSAVNTIPETATITGDKRIGVGTLILAESLGVMVPGSGMAHFILGDQRGGRITLAFTAVSFLTFFGNEVAIETRAIDDPDIYSTLRYASMGIFLAGYLYDVIGAPAYYKKYNSELDTLAYIKPLDVQYQACEWGKDELNVSMVSFGLSF